MLLLVTPPGPLGRALEKGLCDAGREVRVVPPQEKLFSKAVGAEAVIYAPFERALDGWLAPAPDAARARAVVGAANAPGVQVVVFLLPDGAGYEAEEQVLRRSGKPYMIVRTPLLLDEVAEHLASDGSRSIWVPREGQLEVARLEALTAAVLEAVETDDQGDDLPVASESVAGHELFARAAALTGAVKVHAVHPTVWRAVRPVARWLRRGEPAALGLWDGLGALARGTAAA